MTGGEEFQELAQARGTAARGRAGNGFEAKSAHGAANELSIAMAAGENMAARQRRIARGLAPEDWHAGQAFMPEGDDARRARAQALDQGIGLDAPARGVDGGAHIKTGTIGEGAAQWVGWLSKIGH